MILIPPTHGRAAFRVAVPRSDLEEVDRETLRETLVEKIHRTFQEHFGSDAPEGWVKIEETYPPGDDEVVLQVEATAPTRSRVALVRGQRREFEVPVSTRSQIPIVANPYVYGIDNPYRRRDHLLVFQGWDAETGLMVFDR